MVELPWEYEEVEQIFALWEVWQHAYANNSIPENVTRLIVKQNRKTGETFGFKMRMAPTLDFLLSNGGSLHTNTYLHRDNRLSGIVMFYTLDGRFMNGWRYRDGEIVAALVSKMVVDAEDVGTPTTRMGHTHLDDLFVTHFQFQASMWGPVFHPQTYVLMAEGQVSEGPAFPLGGGSGGANVTPPPPPPPPTADRIFRNPDARVRQMVNEIGNDCMGEELLRRIANNLGSNRLNIGFQTGGGSHYNPNTGTITIDRNAPGSAALLHELFHVYQLDRFGTHQWSANAMNGEMEAWFAEYLFASRGNSDDSFAAMLMFYNTPFGRSVVALGHYFTSNGNVRPGQSDRIQQVIRDNTYPQFRERHPNLSFNNAVSPQVMFTNIQQLSRNC